MGDLTLAIQRPCGALELGDCTFRAEGLRDVAIDRATLGPIGVLSSAAGDVALSPCRTIAVAADGWLSEHSGVALSTDCRALSSAAHIVAAAYARFGVGVFDNLLGELALIVVDLGRSEVIAYRDPMGVKLVVYADTPGALEVASAVRCLRTVHENAELNRDAIPEYIPLVNLALARP